MAYLANVSMQAFEPCTKLFISMGVVIQGTDGIEDEVRALAISKTLQKFSKF